MYFTMMSNRVYIHLIILFSMINQLYGFISLISLSSYVPKSSSTSLYAILRNNHSYYNKNRIISNYSSHIENIYTTYDNKNSIIFYRNGDVEKCFNRTLKLKSNQDIIHVHIVSISYFINLYKDLKLSNTEMIKNN